MRLPHPIRHARRLLTPPCRECRHGEETFYGRIPECRSAKYLGYIERLEGIEYRSAAANLVRGTRHCRFEQKTGGDEPC